MAGVICKRYRDAEIMRQKQLKAMEKKAAAEQAKLASK